jgi:ABC-type uncharacterized transport system substrate-binding protein
MKRRQFITLVGGAAATWPLAAHAQQRGVPMVGFLSSRSSGDSVELVSAFRQGLSEEGFAIDKDAAMEFRWADGNYRLLPSLATELVNRSPDVIVAGGGLITAKAAKSATSTTPIVFVGGGDPVEAGIVASLSHPGGNVTGVTVVASLLGAKRIELLNELVPKAHAFAMLVNPGATTTGAEIADVQAAARVLGQELHIVNASAESDFEPAFETIAKLQVAGLFVGADPFLNSRAEQLVALVARLAIPAIYPFREFAVAGGLTSYGTNARNAYRLIGGYAGKILKGTKPADLPVQQASTFEFVINLKTAKALGIGIPQTLLATADEVIE